MSKKENSREKLLDAARRSLLELGHGATTVKAIARLAGVNHGLVHHYFGSKEQLMVEVIGREHQQMIDLFMSQGAGSVLDVIVRELVLEPERPRLLIEFLAMADQMPLVAERINLGLGARDTMLREKLGITDRGTRIVLGGAILGIAMSRQVDPNLPVELALESLRNYFLQAKTESSEGETATATVPRPKGT